jgi:hypothetical protein
MTPIEVTENQPKEAKAELIKLTHIGKERGKVLQLTPIYNNFKQPSSELHQKECEIINIKMVNNQFSYHCTLVAIFTVRLMPFSL